jgi:putative oxidoreductase
MIGVFIRGAITPLLLRWALAAVFIYHGWQLVGGPDHEWGAAWQKGENAQPAPVQMAVAWGELIGGIALAVGFLTRAAALGIIAIMAGAIGTVHLEKGFDITKGGFEYNVVLIVMCVCLVLGGPGPFAVDHFFRRRPRQRT